MTGSRVAAVVMISTLCGPSACVPAPSKLTTVQLDEIRKIYPGMTANCLERLRVGGVNAMPDQVDQCFEMMPRQRWRGMWTDYYEGQFFCQEAVRDCPSAGTGNIWLSFAKGVRPVRPEPTQREYRIEFIGRRTLLPGAHGHNGMSAHEMLVERVISMSAAPGDKALDD